MKDIIKELTDKHKTISTMESCTGGGVANAITNIEGASEVFSFGAITYSNDYKIKMGVSKAIIDKYTVYSIETAKEMSRAIAMYTNSTYGVGITGKLNRIDRFNMTGSDNIVFISIYDSYNNKYYTDTMCVTLDTRIDNKDAIICKIVEILGEII